MPLFAKTNYVPYQHVPLAVTQFAEDEATEENPDIDLGAYTRRILILPQM